jgi:hypothetical protein
MKNLICLFLIAGFAAAPVARAEDTNSNNPVVSAGAKAKKARAKKGKKTAAEKDALAKDAAISNPDAVPTTTNPSSIREEVPVNLKAAELAKEAEDAEFKNNRMNTAAGSRSPFSGQLSFGYSGATLSDPFSKNAPNPGKLKVPPVVSFSGSVSARYRINRVTTTGVGIGILNQGWKNTTVADPYIDIARSFRVGAIQSRASFSTTLITNRQNKDLGQVLNFGIADEAFYEFSFGLTAGLAFSLDYAVFQAVTSGPNAGDPDLLGSQETYTLGASPYFEYSLTDKIGLRSVIGIYFAHNRAQDGTFTMYQPRIYQTLGVGIANIPGMFLYPYVRMYPYNKGTFTFANTAYGISAIINLF